MIDLVMNIDINYEKNISKIKINEIKISKMKKLR
jgi:hypothetical protein